MLIIFLVLIIIDIAVSIIIYKQHKYLDKQHKYVIKKYEEIEKIKQMQEIKKPESEGYRKGMTTILPYFCMECFNKLAKRSDTHYYCEKCKITHIIENHTLIETVKDSEKKIIKKRETICLGSDTFNLIREGDKRYVYNKENELIGIIYD